MFEQIMEYIILPLIGLLLSFGITFINQKKKEIMAKTDNEKTLKYTTLLANTITNCVLATQQTYVDALKKEGKFTQEAQQIAFENTYNAVLNILSEDALLYLEELYGDYQEYIAQLIEAEVITNKNRG